MPLIWNRVVRGVVGLLIVCSLIAFQPSAQPASAEGADAVTANCTVRPNEINCVAGDTRVGVYRVDGGKWRYYTNRGTSPG